LDGFDRDESTLQLMRNDFQAKNSTLQTNLYSSWANVPTHYDFYLIPETIEVNLQLILIALIVNELI
jgi:hypothetical protein